MDEITDILEAVSRECERQKAKFGEQSLPDGTGTASAKDLADRARDLCDNLTAEGTLEWRHVLAEEFYEALAESDLRKLELELTQVAAVCSSWIRDIRRRTRARA